MAVGVVVGDIELSGNKYEIYATKHGRWSICDPEGANLGSGDTLEQATNNARASLTKRKVRVEVPFVTANGKRGMATGIHARTSDILVTLDGEKTSMSPHRGILRGDTPDEAVQELQEAAQKIREGELTRRRIEQEYRITLRSEVEVAISKKVADNE